MVEEKTNNETETVEKTNASQGVNFSEKLATAKVKANNFFTSADEANSKNVLEKIYAVFVGITILFLAITVIAQIVYMVKINSKNSNTLTMANTGNTFKGLHITLNVFTLLTFFMTIFLILVNAKKMIKNRYNILVSGGILLNIISMIVLKTEIKDVKLLVENAKEAESSLLSGFLGESVKNIEITTALKISLLLYIIALFALGYGLYLMIDKFLLKDAKKSKNK